MVLLFALLYFIIFLPRRLYITFGIIYALISKTLILKLKFFFASSEFFFKEMLSP